MAKIDLDKPRYDQTTYMGRAKHFLYLTNPLNIFVSDSELDEAKKIVTEFRRTRRLPPGYDEEKLWQTKYLYDSAFHPDTGEKMFVLGRMSAQAPMNTLITGCMITFYKSNAATIFWQWINQTFNALVNYTNRSGDAPIPTSQLIQSYCAACGGALGTALYLNSKVKNMKPIYARLVPFAAVCGANFINIPLMRSNELRNGTPIFTPDGVRVGESARAARNGILLVVLSRVLMAVPAMTLTPILTTYATARGMFCRYPRAVIPFQIGLVGFCVTFATPFGCAVFDQRAKIPVASLESPIKLKKGTPVFTPDGERVGDSVKAARNGILLVCLSRVLMAVPGMTLTPFVTNYATARGLFRRFPYGVMPFQLGLVGLCVTFATPLCCALFDQRATISVDSLEAPIKEEVHKKHPEVKEVFFNKGL